MLILVTCTWDIIMRGQPPLGCVHEQKAQGGTVDKCGQRSVYDACGPCQTIQSTCSKFFDDFDRLVVLIRRWLLWQLDLEIRWFSCKMTMRQTNQLLYPFLRMRARGNNSLPCYLGNLAFPSVTLRAGGGRRGSEHNDSVFNLQHAKFMLPI